MVDDFRRHRGWCPNGRPADVRRLDVDVDYGAFPVWTWFTVPAVRDRPAREVLGSVNPEFLGISAELGADLQAWADWDDRFQTMLWRRPAVSAELVDKSRWRANGEVLAQRLADETGDEVVYLWRNGERDVDCLHCGTVAIGHLRCENVGVGASRTE